MPTTIDLCTKQNQVGHLCGYCPGGCFDGPNGRAPTCEPYTGPTSNETVQAWEYCEAMDYNMLFWMNFEDILNISNHADYLRAIPGNTTSCEAYQQSYSKCYWCATDLCFNEDYPLSCEEPETLLDLGENHSTDSVCSVIYSTLDNAFRDSTPEFYNLSIHSEFLLFGSNTTFCDYARQNYHKCIWCHQTEYERTTFAKLVPGAIQRRPFPMTTSCQKLLQR